jgi:hypothetical protein
MSFALLQSVIFIITFTGFTFGLAIILLILFQLSHDTTAITFHACCKLAIRLQF